MKLLETLIDTSENWYLGNNVGPNLRIKRPHWNQPFFLTTNYDYALDYADYGVWKVILDNEIDLNILDFNNNEEVSRLGWPNAIISLVRTGLSDLNSIAADLYELQLSINQNRQPRLYTIQSSQKWIDVIDYFNEAADQVKVPLKIDINAPYSNWQKEKDYKFLLAFWYDISRLGFDGFMMSEFNNKIIALFELKYISKISVNRIDKKTS